MIAYLDSSVVLRVVLGQPDRLAEWPKISTGIGSGLLEVECLRTLDRFRLAGKLSLEESVVRHEAVFRILEGLQLVELTAAVLRRAAQPMAAPLGSLDAIHLAAAAMWQEVRGTPVVMATHDSALALAARASGFRVIGV